MNSTFDEARAKRVIWLSVFGGGLLALIGFRFIVVPQSAALTFGLAPDFSGYEMHYIVALRDIWLGGLAIAFALLREWRALALWFIGAAGCCFLDSGIVAASSANPYAMAFHIGSGVFCVLLARAAWALAGQKAAVAG